MDGTRFDSLVRTVATASSRRVMLKALGGGALAAALGLGGPSGAAACNRKGARCGRGEGGCCDGLRCCTNGRGDGRCRALLNDPDNCGACGSRCPTGATCVHGTCSCDPFNNQCPNEVDGQCTCGAVVSAGGFLAACADRNSACDLDRPCAGNADCPPRSVCLRGCREATDPDGPNRCSRPCVPV